MTRTDFTKLVNLAQPRLGAKVTFATDDFFADKARLISPEDAVFIPGKYDDNGKWMDGWESRRKRGMGHDHAIIRLGQAGIIRGVDIDTSHFTGNFPPAASLDACVAEGDVPGEDAAWTEIVPATNLNGDSHHLIAVESDQPWTHLRLNIFPDGGVARLRVYGIMHKVWGKADAGMTIDLAALENGGRPVVANNEHFGVLANIMAPGKGINMGDGWETRRRREPGNDWAIIELGHAGTIEDILVDTAFFKGNFPSHISLQAALVTGGTDESLTVESQFWPELLSKQDLRADDEHPMKPTADLGPVSHVRINIFPDGGISRLRLMGKPHIG
ncbi:allantoicase [Kordiimonas lacus]|uniref:Probable allantoicase n=1 Tax=Kordiimonas lacus TaxID=637679 RepID=A0A1G6U9K4_9PROT|nr:allantoicase [Kordiimonas lacus]SDD37267.1 allantoicase [Kordiimonas lacus]